MVAYNLQLLEPAVLAQKEGLHGLVAAHRSILRHLDCGPTPV
jgi:hypothetical protein